MSRLKIHSRGSTFPCAFTTWCLLKRRVNFIVTKANGLYGAKHCLRYLLYCSNSWTSLHFKTLKSHTKTLKIRPYMFRSPLKPSSGVQGRTSLGYWIGMLIYICYKHCRYVAVCQLIQSVCVCVCVWVPIWSRLCHGMSIFWVRLLYKSTELHYVTFCNLRPREILLSHAFHCDVIAINDA